MATKWLNLFADCETGKYNLNVNQVSDLKLFEYSVSYAYEDSKGQLHSGVVNTWGDLVELACKIGYKHINILCHNGDGFDFWFLRLALMEDYGIVPKNMYMRNSVNHQYETYKGDLKDTNQDYILERHIKARSKVSMEFRVHGIEFKTVDTYPKFMLSVKSIGKKLQLKGIDEHKLDYEEENYSKFDASRDMSLGQKRKYQKECFNKLTDLDKEYVLHDTLTIYQGYKHYEEIFPKGYDKRKMTLSQNIAEQYEINDWAKFQLMHKIPDKAIEDLGLQPGTRLELSSYKFKKDQYTGKLLSIYDYSKLYYHGGLNMYNDKYVGKTIKPDGYIKHIDLNSSYPTAMHNEKFPVQLLKSSDKPAIVRLNPKYLYMLEIRKDWLDEYMQDIPSNVIKEMYVKYYWTETDSVYLTDVTFKELTKYKKNKPSRPAIPVESYMKWKGKRFAAKSVIDINYKNKTKYKKLKKKAKTSKERKAYDLLIANIKITLNGIYGIPALRAYFPNFEIVDGEWVNIRDEENHLGFKNSERNITFSVFTTAYAFRNLIDPLTYNVEGIDKGFIYADTDSIFMTNEYWDTIKDHVHLDPSVLGAWDLEHDNITAMHVLNHKKYALEYFNKKDQRQEVEVHCGGVRLDDLHADDYSKLDDFVKDIFHEGSVVSTQRSILTKEGTIAIYTGKVELQKGDKYHTKFNWFKNDNEKFKHQLEYAMAMDALEQEVLQTGLEEAPVNEENEDNGETLYYDTPFGTFSPSDLFNTSFKCNDEVVKSMKEYYEDQSMVLSYLRGKDKEVA